MNATGAPMNAGAPVLELAGIHRTEDVHVRRACVYAPIVGATFGFAF